GGEKAYAGKADAEVFVDLEGDDMPDHFEGNEADLSDLIVETLALSIDPYPKLEGERVGVAGDVDDEDDPPFAGLKALKVDEDEGCRPISATPRRLVQAKRTDRLAALRHGALERQ